jgi:pyridoxal phosphate enzyme (YggS family)
MTLSIAENLQSVHEIISLACERSGRDVHDVTLVAVSKKKPAELILEAVSLGVQHFGENRVEEAITKIPAVNAATDKSIIWHMVGHIQGRKAADIPSLFSVVHSIDSVKLARRLSQQVGSQDKKLNALLQINISGETSKSGFDAFGWNGDADKRAKLWGQLQECLAVPCINFVGLMTMAPIVSDIEDTRSFFAGLFELRSALENSLEVSLPELSMGMTDDYAVAIEEGATLVRIGRAIFGERD